MTRDGLEDIVAGMTDDKVGIALFNMLAASLKAGALTISSADGGPMVNGDFAIYMRLSKFNRDIDEKTFDDMINNAIASAS